MKKPRSHEIMMNRAGLKDFSLGRADGGGSSTEHTPKKLKGEKHQEEDRTFQTSWKRGREWLQLRCVACIITATDAEPVKTFLKKTIHCSVCEALKVHSAVSQATGALCSGKAPSHGTKSLLFTLQP